MKNDHDNVESSVQPPPSKRIKLEEDPNDAHRLLSKRKPPRGGQRRMFKSTMEERALILLNDERISAVEPQQVLCRMCGHWVRLFKHTDFSPANWRTHADKCEIRTGWQARVRAEPGAALTLTIPSLKSARPVPPESPVPASSAPVPSSSITTPSTAAKSCQNSTLTKPALKELLNGGTPPVPRRPMKSTTERQSALARDSRCEPRGPHSVLCKMCGHLVKLHNTREYDLWNWHRHAEKCEINNAWGDSSSVTLQRARTKTVDQISQPTVGERPNEQAPRSNAVEDLCLQIDTMTASTEQLSATAEELTSGAIPQSDGMNSITSNDIRLPPEGLDRGQVIDSPAQPDKSSVHHVKDGMGFDEVEGKYPLDSPRIVTVEELSPSWKQSVTKRLTTPVKSEPEISGELLYPESSATGARRRKGRSAEERKQALLSDPRISEVQPNEVFCSMCKKWIKLYKEVDYVESNWVRHAERCSIRVAAKTHKAATPTPTVSPPVASVPSAPHSVMKRARVKSTEERHYDLRADSRIASIKPNQVLCGVCNQWIKLQLYREYDIWNWRKHIGLCEQRQKEPLPITAEQASVPHPAADVGLKHGHAPVIIKIEDVDSAPAVTTHLTAPPKLMSSAKGKDASTPADRRAELERDGRCENIEPQRVTCKLCRRSVGLHLKKDYSLSNWHRHVASCGKKIEKAPGPPPNTPVVTLDVSQLEAIAIPIQASSSVVSPPETASDQPAPAPLQAEAEVQLIASAPRPGKALKSSNSTEDRRTRLLADTRVASLQPNRIQCGLCQHWLKLNEIMPYAPYNWFKHIERCESRMSLKQQGSSGMPVTVKEEEVSMVLAAGLDNTSISTDNAKRKKSTPAERFSRLRADPRVKTIEKYRVQCRQCDKWVKLQVKTAYDPHNWFAHSTKCMIRSDVSTSAQLSSAGVIEKHEDSPAITVDTEPVSSFSEKVGRSTVTDRRNLLLNDNHSAAVEPHRVLCRICQQWIKLRDGKDYVPYNWFKHKRKCERRHGLPQAQIPIQDEKSTTPYTEVVKNEPISVDLPLVDHHHRKMTDEERETQLRADPRLGDVEPGRVFCSMCNSWIKLNMSNGFLPGNWLRHAQRCKGSANWVGEAPESHDDPPELRAVEIIDLDYDNSGGGHFGYIELGRLIGKFEPIISSTEYGKAPDIEPPPPAVVKQPPTWSMPTLRARPGTSRVNSPAPLSQSLSEPKLSEPGPGKRMHRTEDLRKQELEADPRTKVVHPDKILCAMCGRWIQMRRDVSYSPQNWLKHAGICEQRTGFLPKHEGESDQKPGQASQPSQPVTRASSEEWLPYNARVRNQEPSDFTTPALTPANWDQLVYSDSDSDESGLDDMPGKAIPSAIFPSVAKLSSGPESSQVHSVPIGISQYSNVNPTGNSLKTHIPTPNPVASHHANHADTTTVPISAGMSAGMRKPPSHSPPLIGPFTTVPLSFYRTAYAPAIAQHGLVTNRDGAHSPQTIGGQRAVPFVVPASTMLPHLLPRPMLVPISHASGQRSAIPSPFRLPATPPLPPPVGIARTNGVAPILLSSVNTSASGPAGSVPAASPPLSQPSATPVAEHNGVAVPAPLRSAAEQTAIVAQASPAAAADKSPVLVTNGVYKPVTLGVLQLAPSQSDQQQPSSTHEKAVHVIEETTAKKQVNGSSELNVQPTTAAGEPAQDAMVVEAQLHLRS